MIAPTKLIALTVGTTGIVGGGASALYLWGESSISIKEQLKKDNKKLLESSNADLWGIKHATFNRNLKDKHPEIKLKTDNSKGLEDWCKENIDSKNETKKYEVASTACTVPSNKEKFLKESKELAGKKEWEKKATEYKTERIDSNFIEGINKETPNKDSIEKWCNNEVEEEYTEDNAKYKRALKWCTKTGE